jgi:hypothetical protein
MGEYQQIMCGSNQDLGYIANDVEHSVPRTYYHLGFPHYEDRKGSSGRQLEKDDGANKSVCTRQLWSEDDIRQENTIRTHLSNGTCVVHYTNLPPTRKYSASGEHEHCVVHMERGHIPSPPYHTISE